MKTKPTIIKRYCLTCSKVNRAGKFKRVSEGFIQQIDDDVRRAINNIFPPDDVVSPTSPDIGNFLTPEARKQVLQGIERKVAQIIMHRIQAHPSIGKTLMV